MRFSLKLSDYESLHDQVSRGTLEYRLDPIDSNDSSDLIYLLE